MAKKNRLGLNDMFPVSDAVTRTALSQAFPVVEEAVAAVLRDIPRTYAEIPVERISPNPYQPRKKFDQASLQELAQSLKDDGMLHPILVRRTTDGSDTFQIVAGERRWRAAGLAEWELVPAEILESCSNDKMKRIALLENIQREQLRPLELAEIYEMLLQEKDEYGKPVHSIRSLADTLKKNKDHVDEHLALLRVPHDVRQLLEDDLDIPLRVIRELGSINDVNDRAYLIAEVRARNLKTADVIAILQQRKKRQAEQKQLTAKSSSNAPALSSAQHLIAEGESAAQNEMITVADHERSLPRPSAAFALVVWERKLQKEQTQLQKVIEQIQQEKSNMNDEGQSLIKTYLHEWSRLLQQTYDQLS